MSKLGNAIPVCIATIFRHLIRLRTDRRGNVAVMTGLLMVPITGALGVGFEISNWYLTKRAMQNAADAAAMAAATNGGSNYDVEAKAVAAQYGYVNGSNNVTVTASNAAACPAGGNTCYSVTISGLVPLFLSQVVGYKGDSTLNGKAAKSVTSTAVATQSITDVKFCLLSLSKTGTGILANGNPKADMTGCDVMSDSAANCNGHNLLATIGSAAKTNDDCGITKYSNRPIVPDPYSSLADNIPADTCKSYPEEPVQKKDQPLPANNQWSGTINLSGNVQICGDLQLSGNATVNAPSGAVLVINNGLLDTNGYTLSSSDGSALTIVFSGNGNGNIYEHYPTGGGTLDFAAPTSGPWSGVAIYQDPKLTHGVDVSAAGNSPTWDITGLVYLPNSNVTFSGAVNKSSHGQSCFVMVVYTVLINGTASILETGGCDAAGLSMPVGTVPARGQLVQ